MTLEEQLNKIAEAHNLTAISINFHRCGDGSHWVGSYAHADDVSGCGSCDNTSTLVVDAINKAIADLDKKRLPGCVSILAPMGKAAGGEA